MARPRHAFTLVELLVVIAVIAVLIAILVPVLAAARDQARNAVSLSNLRSNAQVILTYANDWEDAHPFLTDPDQVRTTLRGGDREIEIPFFWITGQWPFPLTDEYYGAQPHPKVINRPGDTLLYTSYFYSAAMIADPRFWNAETRTGSDQFRRTLTSDVTFPSSKALLIDMAEHGFPSVLPGEGPEARLTMALSDGSVQRVDPERLIPPLPSGEGFGIEVFMPFGVYAMHTVDGVRGRDIR